MEGPEGEGQGGVWGMGTRLPASPCPVWQVTPSPTNQQDGPNRPVDPRIPKGNISLNINCSRLESFCGWPGTPRGHFLITKQLKSIWRPFLSGRWSSTGRRGPQPHPAQGSRPLPSPAGTHRAHFCRNTHCPFALTFS